MGGVFMRMHKRMVGLFFAMVVMMTGLIYRIYFINATDYIAMAAGVQGKYRLTVADTRGVIYDRELRPLVNLGSRYVASVLPTPQAAAALVPEAGEEERPALLERLSGGLPFALEVEDNNLYAEGIDLFRVPGRYGETQYAPHLVGYLSGGVGAAGIEKAYEDLLSGAGGEISVVYQMDAAGRMMQDTAVAVERTGEEPKGGVALTLDRDIQGVVQDALAAGCERGGAVVLDVHTGDILGMASLPAFDQNDIAASLDRDDAPFINRAVSGYNIGSVFKVLVASAALEHGVSQSHEYYCEGYADVAGQVFRCNNNAVHGLCDMGRALEVSCNCYFINLAQQVSPEFLLSMVSNLGLGKSAQLADGIAAQTGNLPTAGELSSPAGYANFSFGQGSSLASPLQMAQAVAAIAGGGISVTPRLVSGTTDDGLTLTDTAPSYAGNRVMSERTAQTMRRLMIQVVEQGSGKPALPIAGSAGGKTSSAQTGRMDADGREIVHAWFAGFYPAEEPLYSIAVFVEGGESGEHVAAPVFKRICDGILRLGSGI